eukprot:TRINITY_DN10004_c0_g1_i1.p1 TRINITY_DN10004_c0_g1~~TRINITY_DN10004_c0_g1_i1.p1  ORF type:complete len:216 (+),score=45.56 TRINITY_DN10004_c0_g1_i1:88-735(+)
MFKIFEKHQTFRPKKLARGAALEKHIFQTLGSGDLKAAVKLPQDESRSEWLAINTVEFFDQVSSVCQAMQQFCSPESCPSMCAGPKYEYYWSDGVTITTPIKVSAPEYVDYLLTWVQGTIDDEEVFPSQPGVEFPAHFESIVKTIFRRMFRIYAHIYTVHFEKFVESKQEATLNSGFKHFYYFLEEFELIDRKELAPVQPVIDALVQRDSEKSKK